MGMFQIGHFVEFRNGGRAIVGVVEGFDEDTGGLKLDCGPEGRWTVTPEECSPWGPPLGALPDDIPAYSAGPALSSASTSGTGGLADTAAQLAGSAKDLARLARDVREELEGRRRELWGRLVEVACEAEETRWEMPALVGKVMGLRSAYRIVTGIGTADLNELLAAELDSRYTDRAMGGEPRG